MTTEFLTQTARIENNGMAETVNTREGDSLVEEMYLMLVHLNGAAYEESK